MIKTTQRRRNILSLVKDIQEVHPEFDIKDCFFILYDNKEITGSELDYLIDWMTL